MFRVWLKCLHFEWGYVGHTILKKHMTYLANIFKIICTKKTNSIIFLYWHAEYSHFDIQRWRYLHITLDHIFSCCVSCNGLSIGIITIYLWNSLGNIFHQSLWKLKFKRTKQTESFFTGPESCRIDTCRSRPSRSDRLDRIEDPATLVCQSEVPWDPPPSERSRK